jgi:hypothetical protein
MLDVGSLLYTRPTGTFNWIIQAVDDDVKGEFVTAFQYTGSPLTANVSLWYVFQRQDGAQHVYIGHIIWSYVFFRPTNLQIWHMC